MKFSKELAEICGIHTGDGYLRNDGKRREWDISGNIEERDYYDKHVIPLFNKIFNLNIKGRFFPGRNTYGFVIRDRKTVEFSHGVLDFPYGNKIEIKIPKFILKNKTFMCSFLKGYFDADGCLHFSKKHKLKHYYPGLYFTTISKNLAKDFSGILKLFNFDPCYHLYESKIPNWNIQYRTYMLGLNVLSKWMKLIGMKNMSKFSRYLIWKKFGFCPPYTTYQQRKSILNGKLNPNLLYKGL